MHLWVNFIVWETVFIFRIANRADILTSMHSGASFSKLKWLFKIRPIFAGNTEMQKLADERTYRVVGKKHLKASPSRTFWNNWKAFW